MNEKREQAACEICEIREKARNFRVFRIFRVLLVLFETWVKAQPQKPVASAVFSFRPSVKIELKTEN
jgi:hypothetical protein